MTAFHLDGFFNLKMKWEVSARMMMRAERFGFRSEEAVTRLHINYARCGYKRSAPLDEQLPAEQLRLRRRALEFWIAERGHEEACAQLPVAVRDVVTLSGTPRGVLTGETAQVLHFIPVAPTPEGADVGERPSGEGTVTPLRQR